jgi:hypothetical protein
MGDILSLANRELRFYLLRAVSILAAGNTIDEAHDVSLILMPSFDKPSGAETGPCQ